MTDMAAEIMSHLCLSLAMYEIVLIALNLTVFGCDHGISSIYLCLYPANVVVSAITILSDFLFNLI